MQIEKTFDQVLRDYDELWGTISPDTSLAAFNRMARAMDITFAPPPPSPLVFKDLSAGEKFTDVSGVHCVKSGTSVRIWGNPSKPGGLDSCAGMPYDLVTRGWS